MAFRYAVRITGIFRENHIPLTLSSTFWGTVVVGIVWKFIYNYIIMQPVTITTNIVSSNPTHGKVNSIQHCYKVCQWLATCRWLSFDSPVSSTNKTDSHDMAGILLKMVLNTITLILDWYEAACGIWGTSITGVTCELPYTMNIYIHIYDDYSYRVVVVVNPWP